MSTTHEIETELCVPVTLLYNIESDGNVELLSIQANLRVIGAAHSTMTFHIDPMGLPEKERKGLIFLAKQQAKKLAADAELERGLSAQESREYERGIEG